MNKLYAVTLALIGNLQGFAQMGVLTSDEMPPIGSTFTYRTVENLAVLDTTTGTNVTWNMAGILPTTQLPWDVDHMAPASTPHPTTFPSSNYVTFESEIPRYNYYDLNGSEMERVGSWANQQNSYQDGQVELVFPLQYGTSSSDTWANTVSSFDGTYSFSVVGSGTLVLPNGTYPDVLLMRVVLDELFIIEQYIWVNAQNGAYLMIYFPGDGFWVPEGAAYMIGASVGINEPEAAIDMRVQSLVNEQLHLTYACEDALTAMVYTTHGQLLSRERLPASTSPITWPLDVRTLSSGMYVLVLQAEQGHRASARFVKP